MKTETRLKIILRPMTLDDIDQVCMIDKLAFPTPWPPRTYRHEITNNDRAKMFVIQRTDRRPPSPKQEEGWFSRLINPPEVRLLDTYSIIAYSGLWHISGEAHISTVAVHPDWQGRKLGELLIWSMARQSLRQHAEILTLEVRVSNMIAQNLYRKYGFKVLGRRKAYYSDNKEDAYNMGVSPLDEAYRAQIIEYGKELSKWLKVEDRF